ncbi:MAG: hypothetical protein KDF64_08355 [Geminicoccaceae bacterium]|nr:hypothetical protein [Geminicoccaceae bacterium]
MDLVVARARVDPVGHVATDDDVIRIGSDDCIRAWRVLDITADVAGRVAGTAIRVIVRCKTSREGDLLKSDLDAGFRRGTGRMLWCRGMICTTGSVREDSRSDDFRTGCCPVCQWKRSPDRLAGDDRLNRYPGCRLADAAGKIEKRRDRCCFGKPRSRWRCVRLCVDRARAGTVFGVRRTGHTIAGAHEKSDECGGKGRADRKLVATGLVSLPERIPVPEAGKLSRMTGPGSAILDFSFHSTPDLKFTIFQ